MAHIADQITGHRQRLGRRLVGQAFDEPGADHDGIGHLGDLPGRAGVADTEPDADGNTHMAANARQRVAHLSHVQRLGTGDAFDGNAIDVAAGASR